jgi:hypothetical protein
MKWPEFKELVIKELAIKAIAVLYSFIRVIDRVQKEETKDIRFFSVKTKNYHVRLLVDNSWDSPCILVRKKGLLKDWKLIDKKSIPECLVQDIFEPTCPAEKRRRLVNKMMELKAFW